jgi:hypothetical protein
LELPGLEPIVKFCPQKERFTLNYDEQYFQDLLRVGTVYHQHRALAIAGHIINQRAQQHLFYAEAF